jgi:thioredoxin
MAEIINVTDANWQTLIGARPALILLTTGEGLRGDFSTAFKKAAAENTTLTFVQANPTQQTQLAATFGVAEKPVLVGWFQGQELVRRVRPWGTDVVLAIELLEKHYREAVPAPTAVAAPVKEAPLVNNKPLNINESQFEAEVINYSHTLPVLVDFWAAWCGPCKMVAPILDKLAGEFAGQIRIVKIDTDKNQGIAQAFRIMSIPTIMAVKGGKIVFQQAGAFPEPAFRDLIKQLIALQLPAEPAQPEKTPQK